MRLFTITKGGSIWNLLFTSLFALVSFAPENSAAEPNGWKPIDKSKLSDIPDPPREFRGVWIATVFNLDWPSKPGLPVAIQKAELKDILDKAKDLNLNAVVLQVRTMCDALYDSPIEPWSYYLTGKIGKAPEPFYDPLEFAIEECHARGLELHAWLNPYRALTGYYEGGVPEDHISKMYPWLLHKNGGHSWLDPSSEFVRNRVITVAFDIVNRYDVDAIHLDDYFYPYPGKGELTGSMDDSDNWDRLQYVEDDPDKADWRRENVNKLISSLYRDIKRHRPWVKVGISPFGIWKSGAPKDVKGLSSYSQIFTDSRKWLQEGWVDYISPQLYWKEEGNQSFSKLYDWWQAENIQGRHLWPGISPSRIGEEGSGGESDGRDAFELLEQISHTREELNKSPASGQLHWHWEAFATNRGGISRMITKKRYADRALPPASPWLAGQGAENDPNPENAIDLPIAQDIQVIENPAIAAAEKLQELIAKADAEAEKDDSKSEDENDKSSAAAEKANAEKNEKAADAPAPEKQALPKYLISWDSSLVPDLEKKSKVRWWAVQVKIGNGKDATWKLHDICPAGESFAGSTIDDLNKITQIAIRSVDRIGEIGNVAAINSPKKDKE